MEVSKTIEIEALCTRTVNRYAIAVGERDHQAFANLFTEDGVWQRPGQKPMVGRGEIHAFMVALPASTLVRHVNGSIRIDIEDGDSASGVSYTTVYNAEDYSGGIALLSGPDYVVEYRDQFRRTGDEWLIARRDTRVVLRASDAAGLPGIPNPNKR